jgi:hypothetical protein
MVLAVMIAAEVVVVSVAVLACLPFKEASPEISPYRLFDLMARRAKVQYKTQDCGPQAEGKKNGLRRRNLSGGRYDTGR